MNEAKVAEIFKSHQGEGLWRFKEQVFVRFFGCNLSCVYCDTKLSFYRLMTVNQVLDKIYSFGEFHSVSLTGGEPLLQVDFLKKLCFELRKAKKVVYLETNGTLPGNLKKIIKYLDMISIDFKLFSSAGSKSLWSLHEDFLQLAQATNSFVKIVVGKKTSLEEIKKVISIIKKINPHLVLVLQPENPYETVLKNKLVKFEKKCKNEFIPVKVIPQLHKKIGIK